MDKNNVSILIRIFGYICFAIVLLTKAVFKLPTTLPIVITAVLMPVFFGISNILKYDISAHTKSEAKTFFLRELVAVIFLVIIILF